MQFKEMVLSVSLTKKGFGRSFVLSDWQGSCHFVCELQVGFQI